jgi:hypothetical protein
MMTEKNRKATCADKNMNILIPDVTSIEFQTEHPHHEFLPALFGLSSIYHDFLAPQPLRLVKGGGVSIVSVLVNSGFYKIEAERIDSK